MTFLRSLLRPTLFLLVTLWSTTLVAQPSGGPYGPVQQRYELPQSGTVYYVAPDGRVDATGADLTNPTTLGAAIARVVTGDSIILRGGE